MLKRAALLIGTGCACCLAIVAAGLILSDRAARGNLINEVRLETGSEITVESFFEAAPEDASIVTDISGIDTMVPGTYPLVISYGGREEDVTLTISDTTAPEAVAVPQSIYIGTDIPEAEAFVTDLYDLSGNVTVDFETVPDKFSAGTVDVTIKVFDSYGNTNDVTSQLTVIDDQTGPEILGAKDLSYKVGEEFNLEEGITAVDDYDTEPEIYIDAYNCNFNKIGVYTLAYIAVDEAGNTTRQEVKLTVLPPEGEEFNDYVYQMADDILVGIKTKKKTKTAKAIFEYVHDNMTYDSSNFGASTPEEAAFIGFTTGTGNCYIYASCCKILLDRAGISSMFITRYPITTSGHFWLLVRLNGKWWHCDATPFMGHEGIYFMLIDSQLDQYHEFDPSKYPARSTTPSGMAVGACVGQAKDYSAVPVDEAAVAAAEGEVDTSGAFVATEYEDGDGSEEDDEDDEEGTGTGTDATGTGTGTDSGSGNGTGTGEEVTPTPADTPAVTPDPTEPETTPEQVPKQTSSGEDGAGV